MNFYVKVERQLFREIISAFKAGPVFILDSNSRFSDSRSLGNFLNQLKNERSCPVELVTFTHVNKVGITTLILDFWPTHSECQNILNLLGIPVDLEGIDKLNISRISDIYTRAILQNKEKNEQISEPTGES